MLEVRIRVINGPGSGEFDQIEAPTFLMESEKVNHISHATSDAYPHYLEANLRHDP